MSVWNRLRLLWYFGIRHRWVKYGNNVHVQLGCFFGGAEPVVEIGNCVGVGFNCFFLTKCRIGNHVLIASNCHFVNRTDHRYEVIGRSIWDSGRGEIAWIEIEDDVWIGQSVVVLAPVVIGRGSVVAAGSVVTRDVPPYSIVAGNPAKVVKMRFTEEEASLHEDLLRAGREVRAE